MRYVLQKVKNISCVVHLDDAAERIVTLNSQVKGSILTSVANSHELTAVF